MKGTESENSGNEKKQVRRAYIRAALFLIVCIAVTAALNFCFIPNSIARANLHRISTKTYEDLFIGTSHGHCSIDPLKVGEVTGRTGTNAGMPSEYLIDSYYIVKLACESGHKPERIIYEWDPGYWMTEDMAGNNPDSFYLRFPEGTAKLFYFLDKISPMNWQYVLEPWCEYRNLFRDIPKTVRIKLGSDYKNYGTADLDTDVKKYRAEGFAWFERGTEWDSFQNVLKFDRTRVGEKPLRYFDLLYRYCKKNGIELTVITLPVPEQTYEAYADAYADAKDYFTGIAEKYGIKYHDFNDLTQSELDRDLSNYRDYDGHMSGELAEKFSGILGEYLKK